MLEKRAAKQRDAIAAASRPWRFGSDIDKQFMHDTYAQLVTNLAAFIDRIIVFSR